MSDDQEPPLCSCAVDCHPATTSIIGCAEHGMPQNLQDTEFPGTSPKIAVIVWQPNDTRPIIIAPLYTPDQVQYVQDRAKALGLRVATSAAIYSLADLGRVEGPTQLVPMEFMHAPGCIYSGTEHPGRTCYVERKHDPGCIGFHEQNGECIAEDGTFLS